jgi:serine/threonine protein kinase
MTPALQDTTSPRQFADGFGLRLRDGGAGELERLGIVGELLRHDGFEASLRERVSRLANFRHDAYARVRRIDRLDEGVALVSEVPPGPRLASILEVAERHGLVLDVNAALCLVKQLVPAVAMLHQNARDVSHGALAPERIVVAPGPRILITEYVLGAAIDQLHYSRDRMWKDLRVAVPADRVRPALDHRADVLQLGLVALALVLGRPLRDGDLEALPSLLSTATEASAYGSRQPISDSLRRWLVRALQLDPHGSFESALEAQLAFDNVLSSESEYIAAPIALEAFLARYEERASSAPAVSAPAPMPADAPPARVDASPAVEWETGSESTATLPAAAFIPPPVPPAPPATSAASPSPASEPVAAAASPTSEDPPGEVTPPPIDVEDPAEPEPRRSERPRRRTRAARRRAAERARLERAAAETEASPVDVAAGSAPEPYVPRPRRARPLPVSADDEPVEPPPPELETPLGSSVEVELEASLVEPLAAAAPSDPSNALRSVTVSDSAGPSSEAGRASRELEEWVRPAAAMPAEAAVTDGGGGGDSDGVHPRWRLAAVALALVALVEGGLLFWSSTDLLPVTSGTLKVESRPSGATVRIDGDPAGKTPLSVSLSAGAHVLEIAAGGEPRVIPLTIESGGTFSQYVELSGAGIATGRLSIRTQPVGAAVLLDGHPRGTTPVALADLAAGEHELVVELDGARERQVVTVAAGETTDVSVALTPGGQVPSGGWVTFDVPYEMQVLENGRPIGTTTGRLPLSAGPHVLQVVSDTLAFRTEVQVDVALGRVSRVPVALPTGVMHLNAIPWAEVLVDGEKVGETPLGNLKVSVGPHEILFRHPDHGERRHAATVTASEPLRLSVDLTQP